jgi:hypothetical protein
MSVTMAAPRHERVTAGARRQEFARAGNPRRAAAVPPVMKNLIAALVRLAKLLGSLEARTALRPAVVPVRK